MNSHEHQLRAAFQRSGLGLLGISFAKALTIKAIRISLECAVCHQNKGKPTPVQPAPEQIELKEAA
jgi:hypothetical protein